MIVKAEALWAEHVCDVPFEQWSIGNETYAVELDDPDEALGRAYGARRPIAFDLEWYAARAEDPDRRLRAARRRPRPHRSRRTPRELTEIEPSTTSRRGAGTAGANASIPLELPDAYAHTGLRAPFAFPDATVADWVLTPDGWRSRGARRPAVAPHFSTLGRARLASIAWHKP